MRTIRKALGSALAVGLLYGCGCASAPDCTIFAGPERELCEAAVALGEKYSPPADAIAVMVEEEVSDPAGETESPEN